MARNPNGKARLTGAAAKNPQRYRDRKEPAVRPIGGPSTFLTEPQRAAWEQFVAELPWLAASDRSLLEIACVLRARLNSGEDIGINQLQVLSAVLSKLGASPVDRTRAPLADDSAEPDEFFGDQ